MHIMVNSLQRFRDDRKVLWSYDLEPPACRATGIQDLSLYLHNIEFVLIMLSLMFLGALKH